MNDHTEENRLLWISFLEGNQEAFSKLYKNSYTMLYAYGCRLQMTEDQIRDSIHDLFLKLYTNPSILTTASTIRPFLMVSLRNAFINLKKKEHKHVDLEHLAFDFKYTVENDFWNKDEQENIKTEVEHIIKQLTPRQKEIIYLRFLYQMSYAEIAEIMDLSEQSARNLVYRTIDRIRKDNMRGTLSLLVFLSFQYT